MQYCTELQTVLYWVPALCETTMSRRPCGLLQAPPERPRSCLSREFDLTDATRVSFRDLLVAVHRKIGANHRVSCGSGWSVPCESIQLTLSQITGFNCRPFLKSHTAYMYPPSDDDQCALHLLLGSSTEKRS